MNRARKAAGVFMLLLLAACAPREILYPLFGKEVPRLREFAADFKPPMSNESGEAVHGFGGGGEGVTQTPVIFIHGNTVNAGFWKPAREHLKKAGYNADEIWAAGYGWNSVRAFDSNDLSVPTLDAFMIEMQAYLSRKTGREIRQFDIVAHSLGVTLVRQWMMQTNKFHWVRNFIGVSGGNHGVWTARPDARGQNRVVNFELMPGSPWLAQLNRSGETPGPTRYMTLYDGSGYGDTLFPKPYEHSPALKGAYNLPYNVKHSTYYDHLELAREPDTLNAMLTFIKQAREALPNEAPPQVLREGPIIKSDQADALVHCASGGHYPSATTAGVARVDLRGGNLLTCYARSERSQLSSALSRYQYADAAPSAGPLSLRAEPAGGVFENPISVKLSADDPEAFIVYTTSGTLPNSGSPLYQAPVYISGPVTLTAIAITPDGRQSEPLKLDYDISLELIDAQHALQRQFDSSAPVEYEGQRKKGN